MTRRRPTPAEQARRLAAYDRALLVRDAAYAAWQAAHDDFEKAIAATPRDELAVSAALDAIHATQAAFQEAKFALGGPTKAMMRLRHRDSDGRVVEPSKTP